MPFPVLGHGGGSLSKEDSVALALTVSGVTEGEGPERESQAMLVVYRRRVLIQGASSGAGGTDGSREPRGREISRCGRKQSVPRWIWTGGPSHRKALHLQMNYLNVSSVLVTPPTSFDSGL